MTTPFTLRTDQSAPDRTYTKGLIIPGSWVRAPPAPPAKGLVSANIGADDPRRRRRSASAVADSRQTLICAYISGAVLIGLLLNTLFGWTWADPVAALVVVIFAIREGFKASKGGSCTVPVSVLTGERPAEDYDHH